MEGPNKNNTILDDNKTNDTPTEPVIDDKAAEPTFTQAQVDEIINKRLAKERAKFDEQLKNKVSEAERLAKLNEDERAKEEIRIAQENLNNMTAEFNKMKADFERQQMLAQVTKELNDRKLPIGMAENLMGKDAEATKANIDAFEETWRTSLADAIKSEIKTNASSPRLELHSGEGQTKDPKDMSFVEFIEYQNKQQQ